MSSQQRDEASMLRSPRVEEVTDSEEITTRMTSAPEEKPAPEKSGSSDEEDYPGITFVDFLRFVMLALITSSWSGTEYPWAWEAASDWSHFSLGALVCVR
ncbi:hypothetical protein KEM56_002408 [Ascosphaera pollenicola]|nr:hypothetical protein KEM56_002408 [Ascosphaera pollenicola]